MNKKALGRGLSALIPEKQVDLNQEESQTEISEDKIMFVQTKDVHNNSLQPRQTYPQEQIQELMNSIKEKGILQPILVRQYMGRYEVVAGERRLRAARELKLDKIPVILKNLTNEDALVIALVENIQREDLNPMEEAQAYKKLIDDFNLTQDKVAQSVGKNRTTVTNVLRLLKLPKVIQDSVSKNLLSMGHARALLGVQSDREQQKLFQLTMTKGLSVRELEKLIRQGEKEDIVSTKTLSKSPDILRLEESLRKNLGTKVEIAHKKKKGKIVIEYYSLEDLDRILEKISV